MSIDRPFYPSKWDPREWREIDSVLRDSGLRDLSARIGLSRQLDATNSLIEEVLNELLSHIRFSCERNLMLGGRPVPYVLFAERGIILIFGLETSTQDPDAVRLILADKVMGVGRAISDLRALLGGKHDVAIKAVVFCPFEDEKPRAWFNTDGREIWTVGGLEYLKTWLSEQPGPGLSSHLVEAVREGAKPRPRKHRPPVVPADEAPSG